MFKLTIGNKNYSSWSLRPWVLMKEFNIPFTEELTPFIDYGSWAEFRAFSPTGTVPVLIEESSDTLVWDSLAIIEYLNDCEFNVWPEDKKARAWARCAAAEMHSGFPAIRNICNMTVGQRVKLNEISPALQKDINRLNELWNEGFSKFGGTYLAGNSFTAVDAFFAPIAYRVRTYSLPLNDTALNYANKLLGLDSMQEWETAALKETWREPVHEKETTDAGEVLEDFRV